MNDNTNASTPVASRTMMRAKVHRIAVTMCDLEYEGSLTLDTELMQAADMIPYERVEVYDITNGNRFATYLIKGEAGSGECCLNGAAAHMVDIGDKIIITSYVTLDDDAAARHVPKVVLVGDGNKIKQIKDSELARVRA